MPDFSLLRNGILEQLAGLEYGQDGGGDLNLLLGPGIPADAGGALLNLKRAEAHQLDLVALLQGLSDGVQHGGDDRLGVLPGDVGGSGDGVDQFSFCLLYTSDAADE